jgi:hypothetical protein
MGGSLAEAVAGAAAAVLAIIGLASGLTQLLMGVTTIVVGVALVFKGASLTSRFSEIVDETCEGRIEMAELGSGTTAESIGGLAGIALGILAVLQIVPVTLTAAAVIVYGGAIMLGAGANARLNRLHVSRVEGHEFARTVAREAVSTATAVQLLIGLSAITLGILGLVGIASGVLTLVGLLAIGGAILLSGTAVSGRMLSILKS